ncbi:MAG: AAA family ATPase [Propionibacteriales bacterium]|nr:AAA family ATPase [Propionibacteriales bacterium]
MTTPDAGPSLVVAGGTMGDMQPVTSPAMVGRVAELEQFGSALDAAAAGQPLTLLVGGDAGVGKTRLLNEFAAEAVEAGARVVLGQCVELGGDGLAYAPIIGVLRDLVGQLGVERLVELAGPGRDALAGLLPELRVSETEALGDRGRLFDTVAVLLERVAAERPLVVVLEDLHWADASTRDLLRFVARAYGNAPILVVGSYRTDELHRTHPLRAFLAELDRLRTVQRIVVPPLSVHEVSEQLAALRGQAPPADLVTRVHERTEGIPFFVEELAAAESDESRAPMPDSLRDLLLVRFERLSDDAQQLLRLMSAGGTHVDHRVLAAVADDAAETLDHSLREAVSGNVVRVDGDGYAFRHALLREAVHDDLLPGEHVRLHVRYAETLEQQPELVTTGSAAIEIAHHWYAAHEQERAFSACQSAAVQAARGYAYGEALLMWERVLELWHRMPEPVALCGCDRGDVLRRAAFAARNAGELDRGLALVEAALAEPEVRTNVSRRADLSQLKATLLSDLGRPGATAVVEEALAAMPEGPSEERARLLQMLAARRMMEARLEESLVVGAEALAEARVVGVTESEFRVHNSIGPSLVHLGRIDEGFAHFREARRLAESSPTLMAHYPINVSDALHLLGRYAEAAQVADEGIDRCRDVGLARTLGAMVVGNAAEPRLALGEWDEAERLITRGLELDPAVRHVWHLLRLQAWLQVWRGDLEAAAASFGDARARTVGREPGPQYTKPLARVAAELAVANGDPEQAWLEVVAELTKAEWAPGYDLPLIAAGAMALGARRRAGSDGLTAEEQQLRALLADIGDWGQASVWRAVVDAELASGAGDEPEPWQAVLDLEGKPAHLGPYAGYRLGRALTAAGERTAASAALRDAAEQADRLGSGLIRGWVDDLSRRARLPLLGEVRGSADSFGLTSREHEVLRLVAAGRSNRQIGEELFISGKTASVHVSNILSKLGVSGRGEAAAVAHENRLFDADRAEG